MITFQRNERSNSAEYAATAITAPDLAKLADILRCPVSYFYGDVIPERDTQESELIGYFRALPPALRPVIVAGVRAMQESAKTAETPEASK
ncbi:MAG: hypothetical protein ACLQVD_07325 [Capsulimonadaceae bacterium]